MVFYMATKHALGRSFRKRSSTCLPWTLYRIILDIKKSVELISDEKQKTKQHPIQLVRVRLIKKSQFQFVET